MEVGEAGVLRCQGRTTDQARSTRFAREEKVRVVPGQIIDSDGSATDADEVLPASALEWLVNLHHNTHVHVIYQSTGSQGSIPLYDHGVGTYSYEVIRSRPHHTTGGSFVLTRNLMDKSDVNK